jgi:hypothetical protein
MQQRSVRRVLAAATLVVGTSACSKVPPPPEADATPAAPATVPEPANTAPAPLSAEDQRLIAADPKTLSPEDRRKRAYALRRKIMQDPDSPAARTLTDLQQGLKDGTITPPGRHTLSLPGTEPKGGAPPAGYRPPAGDDAPATGDAAAP